MLSFPTPARAGRAGRRPARPGRRRQARDDPRDRRAGRRTDGAGRPGSPPPSSGPRPWLGAAFAGGLVAVVGAGQRAASSTRVSFASERRVLALADPLGSARPVPTRTAPTAVPSYSRAARRAGTSCAASRVLIGICRDGRGDQPDRHRLLGGPGAGLGQGDRRRRGRGRSGVRGVERRVGRSASLVRRGAGASGCRASRCTSSRSSSPAPRKFVVMALGAPAVRRPRRLRRRRVRVRVPQPDPRSRVLRADPGAPRRPGHLAVHARSASR